MESDKLSLSDDTEKLDPWDHMKRFTDARIALGRCGVAQPIRANLEFRLAHSQARDAVHCPFQKDKIQAELSDCCEVVGVKSEVCSRDEFLTRPDKGRRLNVDSVELLKSKAVLAEIFDVCFVIADGLSSRAIHENAVPFMRLFLDEVSKTSLSLAPIVIAENARVALADEVGQIMNAKLTVMMIGERPGLSSPNSMGIYMTYGPAVGSTDESRNCISNIRKGGLSIGEGVQKLSYLIEQALHVKSSGVRLKDNMKSSYLPFFDTLRLKS